MAGSISGLASGLDTATIIDQLMQLEAVSQNRLKTRQTTQKSVLAALQSLNTDVAALAGKAETLAKATTWQAVKGTSNNPLVTVTAAGTATPSTFSIKVDALATAAQTTYAEGTLLGADVVTGPVSYTDGAGVAHAIATSGTTLADLVKGINDAKVGVTATTMRTGTDSSGQDTYRLQLTADTGETTEAIGLSGVGLTVSGSTLGTDAVIDLGAGLKLSSTTNTFTGLVTGVNLTLTPGTKVGDAATITVAQDASGVKASVKALVDQMNALLTKIDTQTKSGSGSTAGVLAGDATARSLRSALVNTVFGSDNTTSMASAGIQTDRYGKLVFSEADFDKAYAADPAKVAALFTEGDPTATPAIPDGWAARLQTVAKAASDPAKGALTTAITGRQTSIDRLGDDIEAWDLRLELRRTSLTRTYTALETALSKMQSQGNWLAGQLGSLPSYS